MVAVSPIEIPGITSQIIRHLFVLSGFKALKLPACIRASDDILLELFTYLAPFQALNPCNFEVSHLPTQLLLPPFFFDR